MTLAPGRACASPDRSAGCTTPITGYPPVVGWSARNTSGCPSAGTWIAPRTTPSGGSSPATARVRVGPASRAPTRLLNGERVYALPANDSTHQSSRGPGRYRSSTLDAYSGTSTVDDAPAGSPSGSTSLSRNGCGPSPDRVSVDRLPSTGGTSIPPATAR